MAATFDASAYQPVPRADLEQSVIARTDIVFGRTAERDLALDLYRPEEPAAGLPIVVFVHGGGWHGGDKASYGDLAAVVASHGYLCACVNYRLSGEAPFPAALEDCKAAVRWLRARAPEHDADPGAMAVWGHSAGGHLAAMVALTPGRFEGERKEASSAVHCALCYSTPLDLVALGMSLRPSVEELLGSEEPDRAAARRRASPIEYVGGGSPPFLVCHGAQDDVVPVEQSDQFVAALRGAGVAAEFIRVPDAGHDLERHSPDLLAAAVRFLDRWLKAADSRGGLADLV